jgi:hypothetical protein
MAAKSKIRKGLSRCTIGWHRGPTLFRTHEDHRAQCAYKSPSKSTEQRAGHRTEPPFLLTVYLADCVCPDASRALTNKKPQAQYECLDN